MSKDQIRQLKQDLKVYQQNLQQISAEFKKLKTSSLQDCQQKDRELKELRTKLTTSSQERDNLQQRLDDQVQDLENSSLDKDEKQK